MDESYYNLKDQKIIDLIYDFLREFKAIDRPESRGRRVSFQNQEERRKEYQRNYQRMLREKRKRVNNGVGINNV